jgi:glycosyltransferase involved in cell wall biosynthesis
MRIAVTTATNWPHVRRGGERFVNELAAWLSGRGHEVTIISAGPGKGSTVHERGYRTIRDRRLWHPSFARLGVHEAHVFMATGLARLLTGRYDLVQCTSFLDTYAATLARRATGVPCVFWVNSIPTPVPYVRALTLGGRVFRRAMRDADEVIALSEFVRGYLAERFGRGGMCLPVPVDAGRFRVLDRRWTPLIVCGAALDDPRKGGALLMRAFNRVKQLLPDARLRLVGPASAETRHRLMALVAAPFRDDVRFESIDSDQVPEAFGEAAVTVLPALWESFGMVVMESLSCGTPVVGARHGALPELITDSWTGRLFDPGPPDGPGPSNVDGLARALLEALWLSRIPETRHRCRARAEQGSWEVVGPRFEQLYEQLLVRRRAADRVEERPA